MPSLRSALASLVGNRMRTSLTILGIGIGIAAVICTAALGAAGAAQVQAQIDSLGEDFLWVRPGSQWVSGSRSGSGAAQSLTAEDAAAMVSEIPEVSACSPIVQGREQIIVGGNNWNTRYQGVRPEYFDIRKRTLTSGTFFSRADLESHARVMVIGAAVAAQLFADEAPAGRIVRMNGFPFRVIGVLRARGAGRGGPDRDDVVFVPITTAYRNLDRRDSVSDIMCAVTPPERMTTAEEKVTSLLRWRHELHDGEDSDFEILRPIETIELRAQTGRTMALMLVGIGAVSLLVAGVGVMNIMLVSVAERSREIGVRLAIGARVGDIRRQFLGEAAVLGLAGGLVGVIVGVSAAWMLSAAFGYHTVVSPGSSLGAAAAAVGAALVFGTYPAYRAANLDPIDAIRTEE